MSVARSNMNPTGTACSVVKYVLTDGLSVDEGGGKTDEEDVSGHD